MQVTQKIINRVACKVFCFRFIADHSRFCIPAKNPIIRAIPVPVKIPSAITIRISNMFALMNTLLLLLLIHKYKAPRISTGYPEYRIY
jgi:hypothetical protein